MGLLRILKNRNKVLGLNSRYLEYIRPNNLTKSIEIADDKILTKKVLNKAEIPTPELIGVISTHKELEDFDFDSLPKSFVIKPVNGVEGGGIEIFYNKKDGYWIKSDGSKVSQEDLVRKMDDILDGRYSLHNQPDRVMIEERVKSHKAFRYYTYKGTPDIRIIVYNKVPIMGMLRLPTEESGGRANLKLGAIGGAIDIAVGRVMTAVKGKKGNIEYIPHSRLRISGLRVPYWNRMLEYAVRAAEATGLGWASVDFLIDREKGPLIVELNARTGLSIQLADREGMRERLERVKGTKVKTIKQGIRLGKDLFGGEIEETVENITGRQVIGLIEEVTIISEDGKEEAVKAKVDTGADKTSVDKQLLSQLGYKDTLEYFDKLGFGKFDSWDEAKSFSANIEERMQAGDIIPHTRSIVRSSSGVTVRPQITINLDISGVKFESTVNVADRSELKYKMILGKKDLSKFLINPLKISR